MAKKKFYAVRSGHTEGVFYTWADCQKATSGYSGAEFKSFTSEKEANEYLKNNNDGLLVEGSLAVKPENYPEIDNETVVAYVDGSFKTGINKYTYGLILITPSGEELEFSGSDNDPKALESRNIAGELLGSIRAVEKAIEFGYKRIKIKHDYQGIAKWYTKEWKANKYVSKQYVEKMNSFKEIVIEFEWVKGHSNNKYNDRVDYLAKIELGEVSKTKQGDSYLSINNFILEEFRTIIELVSEEIQDLRIEEKENNQNVTWKFKYSNINLTSIYYKSRRTLLIQGGRSEMFTLFQTYVLELVEPEKITEIYKEQYEVVLDKDVVETDYQFYLPNKSMLFSPKLEQSIKQAILNLQLSGEHYEFTHLVFPALRSLEGFLRNIVLKNHNIICKRNFDCFEAKVGIRNAYQLSPIHHSKFGSRNKIQYVNKIYDYYNRNRNSLFHWDFDEKEVDSTRMVSEKGARDITKEVLNLIDEYFTLK